ncbi:hypothetical protein AYI68_g3392 [Smittium mucronatum]|uniref:BZIP domain-containing protein n=1 Tax=Smittium mucronatum TaxID=133383 RepID=A0A1R0H018_9FUNG|nr:hypothetical protein AYI68_g3392 [Smittium mucronatum]
MNQGSEVNNDTMNIVNMENSPFISQNRIGQQSRNIDSTNNDSIPKTPSSRSDYEGRNRSRQRPRPKHSNTPEELAAKAERNRAAQRAFRQRRDQYVKDLEWRATQFEELQHVVHQLADENQVLRVRVESLTHHINQLGLSVPPLPPISRPPVEWVPVLPPPPPISNSASRRSGIDSIQRIASQPGMPSTNNHSPSANSGHVNQSTGTPGGLTQNQESRQPLSQIHNSNSNSQMHDSRLDDKFSSSQSNSIGFGNILQPSSQQQQQQQQQQHQGSNIGPQDGQNVSSLLANSLDNVSHQLPMLQGQQSNLDFNQRSVNQNVVNQQSRGYMYQSPTANNQIQNNDYNPFGDRIPYPQMHNNNYVVSARYPNDLRMDMRPLIKLKSGLVYPF